jgi:hypothetical protein
MILETVELTPEDAAKLLAVSQGHHQRRLKQSNIDRLTRAIISGQWRETHQAIALNRDGIVIDGQHRLTAIVAAGRTVRVLIARDVADESFEVIDTGAARSPYDVLSLAGVPNAAKMAASCRYLLTYEDVVGTTDSYGSHRQKFTSSDILALARSPRGDELNHSLNAATGVAWTLGRTGFSTWLGVVVQLMRESPVDDGLCLEFLERLRDGANLKVGSPLLSLRRFLTGDGGLIKSTPHDRGQVGMGTTIKAFNVWLSGGERQLFHFRTGIERMPAIVPTLVDSPSYIP